MAEEKKTVKVTLVKGLIGTIRSHRATVRGLVTGATIAGVRVSWMLAIGWGLAAVLGAVSGLLIAPANFLTPNLMQSILLYAFASAVVGGIESPIGAVVGGLLLGVVLNLLQR